MERIQPFFDLIKEYKIETFLLSSAFVIACVAVGIYFFEHTEKSPPPKAIIEPPKEKPIQIVVDVEGAVIKPGVHNLSENSRLKDAIEYSGGLSEKSDRNYFFKNFNLAKILVDQEKVYIPTAQETGTGFATQTTPESNITSNNGDFLGLQININTASEQELDKLPSVGKVTAQKIVSGRPYQTVEDLTEKKIVSNSIFEKIKNLITVTN